MSRYAKAVNRLVMTDNLLYRLVDPAAATSRSRQRTNMIESDFLPMEQLTKGLRQSKIVKFCEFASKRFANTHLKELAVSAVGPQREMRVGGQELVNFGFDSFLGLDQDPRIK